MKKQEKSIGPKEPMLITHLSKKTDSSVFDVFTYPKRIQSFTTNLLSNTMKNTFI